MITKDQVLRSLFARLATIYPMPERKDGQAEMVAARCANGITEEQLENLAIRINETRKQKTFPSVQELIEMVRVMRPPGQQSSGLASKDAVGRHVNIDGRVSYDGPRPMTWVLQEEPIFSTLAAMHKQELGIPAYAHSSKYAEGLGYFFPTSMFEREFAHAR